MSKTPHTLSDEFPGQADRIHALKLSSAHFARLSSEYDADNDQVHRAEIRVEPMSQEAEEALRRNRSRLKDAIARALRG